MSSENVRSMASNGGLNQYLVRPHIEERRTLQSQEKYSIKWAMNSYLNCHIPLLTISL